MYRITFSKSLADHINHRSDGRFELRRVMVKVGEPLEKGQISSTGAYALLDSRKRKLLRVSLDYQVAQLLIGESRALAEATIELLPLDLEIVKASVDNR